MYHVTQTFEKVKKKWILHGVRLYSTFRKLSRLPAWTQVRRTCYWVMHYYGKS
eukprot:SAG11_NODE_26188_length_348_cov_1.550201_1_plen_52_part_10